MLRYVLSVILLCAGGIGFAASPSVIQFQDGITKPELEALINSQGAVRTSLRISSERQYPSCNAVPKVDFSAIEQVQVKVSCSNPFWKRTIRTRSGYATPKTQRLTRAVPETMDVVVLRKSIAKGHILGPEDVTIHDMPVVGNDITFTNPADIIGREVIAHLGAGQAILSRHLQTDWIIRKGAPVQIIYQRAGINILAPGKALDNGQLGEVIQVENNASMRTIRGQVMAKNKILVRAKMN